MITQRRWKCLLIILVICAIGCVTPQSIRQDYVRDHPDLDPDTRYYILAGRIVIGMTEEQVEAAWWRSPTRQYRSYSHGIETKMWVYGQGGYYTYIHFTDGHVTGISRNY